jgi:serine/threonine protein kinase
MIGTKLAHFAISQIGSGGISGVYQSTDTKARGLASLNHSNIAGIYGVEEINGRHFVLMEPVDGHYVNLSGSQARRMRAAGERL